MDTSPILKRNAQRYGNQDIVIRENPKYEPLEMGPVAFIPHMNNHIAAIYPYIQQNNMPYFVLNQWPRNFEPHNVYN